MMPERNCATCTAAQKKEWGCEGYQFVTEDGEIEWLNPAAVPVSWDDGEDWWACPRQDLYRHPQEWSQRLMYYGMYQKGFLPDPGSVSQQSAYAIEVFRIFDVANAKADDAKDAEAKRKAARG